MFEDRELGNWGSKESLKQTLEALKYKHPHRRPNHWGCLFNYLFSLTGVYQMTNPIIQTDIADILKEIKLDQKEILKEVGSLRQEVNEIKVNLETVKGNLKALDTKVEQLDKRLSNSELTNRGILIGLVVIILGGAAKLFGFMGNS